MTDYPHGNRRRYRQGCDCALCREAQARYERHRVYEKEHGRPRTTEGTGTLRRLQALAVMGHPIIDMSARLGLHKRSLHNVMYRIERNPLVYRSTAEKVAALYEELVMLPGRCPTTAKRARNKGWCGPLCWDNIDDPDERPNLGAPRDRDVDPVVVQRILDGHKEKATKAEKHEVLRRWTARGGSLRQLTAQTGWKVERYVDREVA